MMKMTFVEIVVFCVVLDCFVFRWNSGDRSPVLSTSHHKSGRLRTTMLLSSSVECVPRTRRFNIRYNMNVYSLQHNPPSTPYFHPFLSPFHLPVPQSLPSRCIYLLVSSVKYFISNIYIAPLQENYSLVLQTPARLKMVRIERRWQGSWEKAKFRRVPMSRGQRQRKHGSA